MAKRFHFYENPNPKSITKSQEDKDAWFGTKPEDGDAFWAKRIPGLRETYGPAHNGTKEIDTEPHDMFYCDIEPLPPVIHIEGGKTFPLPLAVIAAVINRSSHRIINRRCTCRTTFDCQSYDIMILQLQDASLGILVDSVQRMIDLQENTITSIPTQNAQKLVSGMCSLPDGQTMLVFDCDQLSSPT